MSQLGLILLAALALAFGVTAFTTVSVRSENARGLVASTFVVSFIVLVALFFWAGLPGEVTATIAGVGLMIGILCSVLLRAARHFEHRSGYK